MKLLAIGLALVFAASIAEAYEPLPRFSSDTNCWYCTPMEIDRLAALITDEALRDMVCRLSSERFTLGSLSRASGLSEGQVMRRISTLRGWGLVRMVRRDSSTTIIEPFPGEGAQTLKRWANRYCPQGEACAKPSATSESERQLRANNSSRLPSSKSIGAAGVSGSLITVFGGSGFIGRELVKRLLIAGAKVRVVSRNPHKAMPLTNLADDRALELLTVDIGNQASVEKAVAGADMVVSLVGINFKNGGKTVPILHTRGSCNIAKAAAKLEAARLVLVSAIGTDLDWPNVYSRTKEAIEAAARKAFPEVTVVHPSLVIGAEDQLFNRLARLARVSSFLPEFGNGETVVRPVFVGDVGEAIVRILEEPNTKGKTYELDGPRNMTLRETIALVTKESGNDRFLVSVPFWFADPKDATFENVPNPMATQEQVTILRRTQVVHTDALGLADLGIEPTRIEDVITVYLGGERGRRAFEPAY